MDFEDGATYTGKEFHAQEAATEKMWSPLWEQEAFNQGQL